jgi:REP element-mobilizing transposase RayT
MRDYKSLSHTRWDCKYHVVFIPKKRQKLIYGAIRKHLGVTFHELAQRAYFGDCDRLFRDNPITSVSHL